MATPTDFVTDPAALVHDEDSPVDGVEPAAVSDVVEGEPAAEPAAEPVTPTDDVASLKAELSALKEMVGMVLKARQEPEPAPVAEAEPVEPEDPEPDVAKDASSWVRWAGRQETKAAIEPLRNQIKELTEVVKSLAPIGEERAMRSKFDTAFAEVAKAEPKMLDRDFNGKVAAAIESDPELMAMARSNPAMALRVGARLVNAESELAGFKASAAKTAQARADRSAGSPPRGAVAAQGTAVVTVARNVDEAWSRAMQRLGLKTN